MRVPRLCEGLRVVFPRHHRAENTPARAPCHITHHLLQVEIYLVQRFVYVLNILDGIHWRRHTARSDSHRLLQPSVVTICLLSSFTWIPIG